VFVGWAGVAKLADFGASRKIDLLNGEESTMVTTLKGTPFFMAPEVIGASKYGRRSDVWSLGCAVYEMLTALPPWKSMNPGSIVHLYNLIDQGIGPPPFPSSPSSQDTSMSEDEVEGRVERELVNECEINRNDAIHLSQFLVRCFQRNPKLRPTAFDISSHPFLEPSSLSSSNPGTPSPLRIVSNNSGSKVRGMNRFDIAQKGREEVRRRLSGSNPQQSPLTGSTNGWLITPTPSSDEKEGGERPVLTRENSNPFSSKHSNDRQPSSDPSSSNRRSSYFSPEEDQKRREAESRRKSSTSTTGWVFQLVSHCVFIVFFVLF